MMKAMVQEIQSEMECNSWERMKAQYAGEIQIYIYISSPNLRKRVDLIKTMATYLWVLYDFRKGKTQKSVQHMHTCVRVRAYAHACVCVECVGLYMCVWCMCVCGVYPYVTVLLRHISSFVKDCNWIFFPLDGAISLLQESFMNFIKRMLCFFIDKNEF